MSEVLTIVEPEATSIVALVERTPAIVLQDTVMRDALLAEIEAEVEAFVPDLSTGVGRKAVASLAYKVSQTKSAIEAAAKDLTEDWRKQTAVVNRARSEITEKMDALRDRARAPLTQWEQAEKERDDKAKATLDWIKVAGVIGFGDSAAEVAERLEQLQALVITAERFGSWFQLAEVARSSAVEVLTAGIERIKREEADRAELARLRAQNEAREKADAERAAADAKAAKAAAAALEAERVAKERAEAEAARVAKAAEEAAARAKAEAEERHAAELAAVEAAAQAERDRVAAEKAAEEAKAAAEAEAERVRRENEQHRADVRVLAQVALVNACGVSAAAAKKIIAAIDAGTIPRVLLDY